jgi:hypothetical protein
MAASCTRSQRYILTATISFLLVLHFSCRAYGGWRDALYHTTLENSSLRAEFQAGLLYELENKATGDLLINLNPVSLSASHCLFGTSSVNLDIAAVSQIILSTSVQTTHTWGGGTSWDITWTLTNGDLILQTSAQSPSPVEMLFFNLTGCDIANYKLIAVDNHGASQEMNAPFNGALLLAHGGTNKCDMPGGFAQSLVTLFEGSGSGWVVEGRDLDIGPSNIRPFGEGQTAELVISRRFPLTSTTPELYEVRIRAYNTVWQDAVDPHINWMENTVGYVPIDQKPQAWVEDIVTQAYVNIGDTAALTAMSDRVNPYQNKTYIGRGATYRNFAFDIGYPDYDPEPGAITWIDQARTLGFHVGVHVNAYGIDRSNTALLTQMEPGLYWNGSEWDGPPTFAYCSPGYQPWRAYLINAINKVIDPDLDGPGIGSMGADVIYLDQTMSPVGQFVVNGVAGIQGVMLLEQELLAAYSAFDVVIQTEQCNPMASRHASFALSQVTMGHPLSGYLLSRFIKIVPESFNYRPVELQYLDPFTEWGHFTPGADTKSSPESWLEITDAFRQYDLIPNSRLPLGSGFLAGSVQVSGFSGSGLSQAFFEESATTRSLVVYRPANFPEPFGLRHTGITEWAGPGYVEDWLLYNGSTMVGLDPNSTYFFDALVVLDPNRFHITAIPADYQPYSNTDDVLITQEIGLSDTNFRIFFSGNGQMSMSVPDDYDVYLDNQEVIVNRTTDSATVTVSASPSNPSVVRAFQRSEQSIEGYWMDNFSSRPQHKIHFVGASELFPPNGLYSLGAGEAFVIGKLPLATNIRAQGNFKVRDSVTGVSGEAVIKINGTEVMRLDPGSPPYSLVPFDVDISSFSGKYVMLEFSWGRNIGNGTDQADWDAPLIFVSGLINPPENCAEAKALGYGLVEDFDNDCYIGVGDFASMILDWLRCVEPSDPTCEHPWE